MSQKKEDADQPTRSGEAQPSDTLPWDDSDFARISQDVTRAEPAMEAAPSQASAKPVADETKASDGDKDAVATSGLASTTTPALNAVPVAPSETDDMEEAAERMASLAEDREQTAAGKLLDEEFPRLIRLKELTAPAQQASRRETPAQETPAPEQIPENEPAGFETILPPRKEPSFATRRAATFLRSEPSVHPRDILTVGRGEARAVPALEHRSPDDDDRQDPWGRTPPRFDDAFEAFPTRVIPEPIVPQAFAPAEDWPEDEGERGSPLRWAAVAAFLVVGCYAAVNALQPERFFGGTRQMDIAQDEFRQPPPAPTTSTAPSTSPSTTGPAPKPAPTSAARVEEKAPKVAEAVKAAKAERAPAKKLAAEKAASKPRAATPAKAVMPQTTPHGRNEPDEAELEAMAEQQSRPVVLAPGPRMLDASPAIPASLPTRLNGDLVYDVQSKLMRLGYSPGPVDGTLSPQTRNAIMHFQNDIGLAPTGEIDAELLRRLRTTRQVDLRFVRGPMPMSQ